MPPTEEDLAWFRSTFHPIPKPALPDDCVEYSLYILSPTLDANNDSELRLRLREVQKYASELQKKWVKDYIWQRQGFSLELTKENGVSHLQGRTEYGDSVEDEWVVVWLLRELTKHYKDLWVKVSDTDGEFLLIEASGTLPAWLEPDVAENRVWIQAGGLVIIRSTNTAKPSKRTAAKLSLPDARQIMLTEPKRLMRSAIIQDEAFYRLRNYPAQIQENMHHALVAIPRKIAFLLRQKPSYISPAVETFYLRDPIALKPLQSKKEVDKLAIYPIDLVTVSAKFPRVGYAQLKSQDFPAPAVWDGKLPSKMDPEAYARAETGMKLSCGFEMLLSDPHNKDKQAVREMKMLFEDIDTGDEQLPTNKDISKWDQRQDDEKWLDISFEDLEGELAGRNRSATDQPNKKGGKFGDEAAQENLQRIVKQFENFLNDDKAGMDGAGLFEEDSEDEELDEDELDDEIDSDPGEDKEASFDEDEFTRMMREMMGMPPEVMKEVMAGNIDALKPDSTSGSKAPADSSGASRVDELESSDSEGDEEVQEMMRRMEIELRASGALDLDPTPNNDASEGKIGMAESLSKGKQPATTTGTSSAAADEHDDSSDDEGSDNDIDVNLVKNLLESLKSQAGIAGPGGNLMGLMGVQMPRDEGDAETSSGQTQKKRK